MGDDKGQLGKAHKRYKDFAHNKYKFQSSNYSNFHILTIDIKVINMESWTNIDDVLHSY